MADANSQSEDRFVDTDVFVVVENDYDYYDFVSIDENAVYEPIVIDMSDEFQDAITVDFDAEDSDAFVSIDEEDEDEEDMIFVSGFSENE